MILAAVANVFFHGARHRWEGGPLGLHAMMDVAAPPEREKIEAIIERHQVRLRELGDQAREARRAAYGIFAQRNFERAAYMQALDKMRAANDALQVEIGGVMAEAATQLTADERQKLATKAEQRSKWHEG